jgi:hypothetical protein
VNVVVGREQRVEVAGRKRSPLGQLELPVAEREDLLVLGAAV